jgi:phosphoribosylformimino-5-aminoimidazole carboxamide ribotide isomerase
MLIVPAIDLRDGRCVRLVQGRAVEMQVYHNEPLEIAKRFAAEGAELIHVVDLDGAFKGGKSSNRSIVDKMTEVVEIPIQFGGGLRTVEDIESLLNSGVARIVLGTLATESLDKLRALAQRFGEAIAVGIDARKGWVMARGWESETKATAFELASSVADVGVKRIIYTDIARDGMLTGPNIEQTIGIARAAGIPITASGGISCLDDLRELHNAGEPLIDSVIVGKALYEGRFTLGEAMQIAR